MGTNISAFPPIMAIHANVIVGTPAPTFLHASESNESSRYLISATPVIVQVVTSWARNSPNTKTHLVLGFRTKSALYPRYSVILTHLLMHESLVRWMTKISSSSLSNLEIRKGIGLVGAQCHISKTTSAANGAHLTLKNHLLDLLCRSR